MEQLKLILAVVLLLAYGAKRVIQKLSKKTTKPWWKESETLVFIVGEVILCAETVGALFG